MNLPNLTEDMETIGLLILGFLGFVIVFGVLPILWKMAAAKKTPPQE
jgi:hypothetical protein